MGALRIITIFDEDASVLRPPARKVKRFGPDLQRLADVSPCLTLEKNR